MTTTAEEAASVVVLHPQPEIGERVRLLILDDEAEVAETIANIARSRGALALATTEAAGFFDALDQFCPTHIALDLRMPGMDGIMILEKLRLRGCEAALIVVSGVDKRVIDASLRSAAEIGLPVAGTLAKPFSSRQLAALLALPSSAPRCAPTDTAVTAPAEPDAEALRVALASGVIAPAFQPKVSCVDGNLIGFEALARWQDPDGPNYTPDQFIPLAEANGMIDALTETMARQSLAWLGRTFPGQRHTIALNISAHSLFNLSMIDQLEILCEETGINPGRLVIEITESGMLGHGTDILNLLTRLRLKGMALSIDDFGVGYSSMVQLARLPFSELKIDKRFIASLGHSSESRTIVSAIIGMAKGLGLRTVAEGVEDLATFSYLKDKGCDVAQGYFIGRPMPAFEAAHWAGHG
ncbi:EAL domain-containing response regulator [Pelagibacterium montanilacus]|uniref:EAL domain-containing response regulator n=1 Tax=Pelagibacterium montanilacus TaxID=2185280 RepID=UPI0013E0456F|nr:EAL domain-containing response regulator [Pelagibacterium montanilacus]